MTQPLLEANGLVHSFGSSPVLQGVDLELLRGERLVVLGPNAAGKTTLLRILAGTLRPLAGAVRLYSRALREQSRRQIARALAIVPQELAVPFPYSVREMVAMGRAPHLGALGRESSADRSAIDAALSALGLTRLADRTFPSLSGGEKQRALLARALAQQTHVLLLDEPTAHMDLGHRLHTFEWLSDWVAARPQERAVLIVTHDLALGARFADRMLLLDQGRIAGQGTPEQVLTPERIRSVYSVEASVQLDPDGRPLIVAARSRFRYSGVADEPDPDRSGT